MDCDRSLLLVIYLSLVRSQVCYTALVPVVPLEGKGMMYLDGEEFEVEPGHVIVNRPGGTHGLKNLGNSELKLVVVEVPVS